MNVNGKTNVLGLLGDPVEHTMSPLIHNTLSDSLGMNNIYIPLQTKADGLEAAVKGAYALNILGLNVTVPHKYHVMQYLSELDDGAKAIGAVNTLVRTETGYKGYNTDMMGLSRELDSYHIQLEGRQVIILGAGGAAKAVAYLCMYRRAGRIYILNRTVDKAGKLAEDMNGFFGRDTITAMSLSDYRNLPKERYIVFQATSIGLQPDADKVIIGDADFYSLVETGIDLIYNPFETRFMKLCRESGASAYNGLKMLLYQGVIAYELWNHIQVPEDIADQVYRKLKKKTRKNIVLIGFMGCGKTTIGKALQETLQYQFLDTDTYIEEQTGQTIANIFAEKGEAYFRNLETKVLTDLQETVSHTIISTGGGMPLREENAELLSMLGEVIYLNIDAGEVRKRLAEDTTRPLLQSKNREEKVRDMLAYRDPFYRRCSDLVIDVAGKSVKDITEEIQRVMK